MKTARFRHLFSITTAIGLGVLSSCSTFDSKPDFDNIKLSQKTTGPASQSVDTYFMKEGIKYLKEGNLKNAAALFRVQLKYNPQHASANFFNGLVYHLKAKNGDTESLDLAQVGYDLAIKFDPSNPVYLYHAGLLELDRQEYKKAAADFASAYMLNKKNVRALYGLAVSAYYQHDLETAAGAIEQALKQSPDNSLYLRTGAIIMAAVNNQEKANEYATRLAANFNGGENPTSQYVQDRIATWKEVHQQVPSANKIAVAKETGASGKSAEATAGAPQIKESEYTPPSVENPYKVPPADVYAKVLKEGAQEELATVATQPKPLDPNNQMVMVDLIIIIADESVSESQGVNLLKNLQLSFTQGSGANIFNWGVSRSKTVGSQTFTSSSYLAVQTSAAYSLNIANVGGSRSEVIAKPSLTALSGSKATFSSGNDIVVATSGSGDNSIAGPYNLGVNLIVTPTLLDNGKVNLNIQANRKAVASSAAGSANTFSNSLYTSHTSIQSTVVMNLGDTLILGGLSMRDDSSSSSHTPVLGDIPIIQYLFHEDTKTEFRKSVIFLVTPRLPDYTYLEGFGGPDADPSSPEVQALLEFKARHTDWFKPYPNMSDVFNHIKAVGAYREFRSGDALVENWGDLEETIRDISTANGSSVDIEEA